MLTQNSELKPHGIYNWTIPALTATFDDGRRITTCPAAGICASLCYARVGTYRFPNVKAAHTRNLQQTVDNLPGWTADMIDELTARRYREGKWVRIHDAGDFYSDDYLTAWLTIAQATPDVTFYCYTREVERFKRLVEPNPPTNFHWLYSLGGKQDHLVNRDIDRHCDVFPTHQAAITAGYTPQTDDDRQAITHPTNRIAVITNNIPHLRTRQGAHTFATLQTEHNNKRTTRHPTNGTHTQPTEPTLFDPPTP
jgi:hypothetical protein